MNFGFNVFKNVIRKDIYGESNRIMCKLRVALKGQVPGHLDFESLQRAKAH